MVEPLVLFEGPLLEGLFVRRYKRFSVEVQMDGSGVWVHTNNTGSMQGLLQEGNRVLVSRSSNPARKMAHTLEFIQADGVWCGVNTSLPGRMLKSAFAAGKLPFAAGYSCMKLERKLPAELALEGESSRLDAVFWGGENGPLWVECKNVTLVRGKVAAFPDAPTERGRKHLRQLIHLRKKGLRAACFFLIQRGDAQSFAPASDIDPQYAALLHQAQGEGVEIYPYKSGLASGGVVLGELLPVCF